MVASPVVYLVVPMGHSYGRELMRGVREYMRAARPWQLVVLEPTVPALRGLRKQKVDALLGLFHTPALERAARELKTPAVNMSSLYKGVTLPRVAPDNVAIARLAAEHFLQRGFRHFAFAGYPRYFFSQMRQQAFGRFIREAGFRCHSIAEGRDAQAIRSLPRPLGVMACNDERGVQVINACARLDARVPEDVAVIGVENDDAICETAQVPLASVDSNSQRIGYEAAAMLDRLMKGEALEQRAVIVGPAGLVVRASADVLAVPDEDVAAAMRYMHLHACDPMRVEDMLGVLKVSRRTLEKRFRTIFGRTLHDEIRRLQWERARQLLSDTDLSIPEVARRCGFRDPKRFTTLFRREFGAPPTGFRRGSREAAVPVLN